MLIDSNFYLGTATDDDGKFRIGKVPVGRHEIQVSYLGYETRTIQNVMVVSGKELILSIELLEAFVLMKELVIEEKIDKSKPINEMAVVSARSFSVEETKRYAASVNDPARMALSFAGVTGTEDIKNEIVIRGNSPRGLLWKLEGIEIPNPNHFAEDGASGGAICILSTNLLANSDFFTGAFPAEYGNALSGVFDIKLRKGNNEKREYSVQTGFLGLDVAIEGPFKKGHNASYLANYRYSTLAIFDDLGIDITGDAVPKYQDLSLKLNYTTKKMGVFSLFGIGGLSNIRNSGYHWKVNINSDVGILGFSHNLFVGKKTFIKSTVSLSGTKTFYHDDWFDNRKHQYYTHYEQDFNKSWRRASVVLNRKINTKNVIKSGIIYSNVSYHGIVKADEYDNILLNHVLKEYANEKGSTEYVQVFTSWKYRILKNFTLNSGLHFLHYKLSNNYSFEPRIGLKWQFHPKQSFGIGFGIHSRIESLANHLTKVYLTSDSFIVPNKHIEFTKARHYVFGYNFMFNKNLHMKIEAYYQYLFDVPVARDSLSYFSTLNTSSGFVDIALSNDGTGTNYGLELTFEKFFSRKYYFMLTASLYESKYKGSNGIEKNTKYNGNYILNLVAGKEFRLGSKMRWNLLGINVRTILAGGNRYTPIDLQQSIIHSETVYFSDQIFSEKVDDYFRIDLQISYSWNRPKFNSELKIDIQNIINRLNMYSISYNNNLQEIEKTTHTGLVPVLSYKIYF